MKIRDKISTVIAYAVLSGPVIILAVFLLQSYFGKIDGEFYHESKDCPLLLQSGQIYSAYRDELSGKTPCEQCAEGK